MQAPNTVTRTSHAVTIQMGSRVIGAIYSWDAGQDRDVDYEYEVGGSGFPVDVVPQNVRNPTIAVQRYDLYNKVMEEVFGSSDVVMLCDQRRPFSIREVWRGPPQLLSGLSGGLGMLDSLVGSSTQNWLNKGVSDALAGAGKVGSAILTEGLADTKVYEYKGCFLTRVGRTVSADGDRVVKVQATLAYQFKWRVM